MGSLLPDNPQLGLLSQERLPLDRPPVLSYPCYLKPSSVTLNMLSMKLSPIHVNPDFEAHPSMPVGPAVTTETLLESGEFAKGGLGGECLA